MRVESGFFVIKNYDKLQRAKVRREAVLARTKQPFFIPKPYETRTSSPNVFSPDKIVEKEFKTMTGRSNLNYYSQDFIEKKTQNSSLENLEIVVNARKNFTNYLKNEKDYRNYISKSFRQQKRTVAPSSPQSIYKQAGIKSTVKLLTQAINDPNYPAKEQTRSIVDKIKVFPRKAMDLISETLDENSIATVLQ